MRMFDGEFALFIAIHNEWYDEKNVTDIYVTIYIFDTMDLFLQ